MHHNTLHYAVEIRLKALDRVVRIFRDRELRYPDSLDEPVQEFYVKPAYIIDPWGQKYAYNPVPSGFEMYSNGWGQIAKHRGRYLAKELVGRMQICFAGWG